MGSKLIDGASPIGGDFGGSVAGGGGSRIGGGPGGARAAGGCGRPYPGCGGSLIGDGVSWTNMVSLLLRCCSASVSHAFAMASRARLFSTLVNV